MKLLANWLQLSNEILYEVLYCITKAVRSSGDVSLIMLAIVVRYISLLPVNKSAISPASELVPKEGEKHKPK